MKTLLVSFLLVCTSVIGVNAQDELLYEKAAQSKLIYGKWQEDPNKEKYESAFFKEFPNDYKTFAIIYGYDDSKKGKPGILYHYSYDHIIKFFGKITLVVDTLYYSKIIAISVDAHWQADAESFFQDVVREHTTRDMALVHYILSQYPEDKILQFWKFYFDGPHPAKTIDKDLHSYFQIRDANMCKLIDKAHAFVVEDWANH
jgi:hypothetical protein